MEAKEIEPKYRIKISKNFKGEMGYEVVARSDSIEELDRELGNAKRVAEKLAISDVKAK